MRWKYKLIYKFVLKECESRPKKSMTNIITNKTDKNEKWSRFNETESSNYFQLG